MKFLKFIENLKNDAFLKKTDAAIRENTISFFKWILFSCIIGIVVGIVGGLFHHSIEYVTQFRISHEWLLYLLPVAGVVIVASYQVTNMSDDKGTEFVISSVRDAKPLKISMAPLVFLGTVLTHLTGGSSGREGAALQIGGSISGFIGHWMHLDEKDERVITMAGMAAGFSALFGTPLASAVLAMEIVSVGVMYYAAIVPCILSAVIAQQVATLLHVNYEAFEVALIPAVTPLNVIRIVALGALCAFVSILFCCVMHVAPKLYSKITDNPYIRVIIGGVLVAGLMTICGHEYEGAGMSVISEAINGNAKPEAFIIKIILTALTLAAGFKGGEIVPAFFTGATFGCVAGTLLGLPASFGAAAGLVSVFCGVTNCPLTSIFLSYELLGGKGVILFGISISVSYMLSGYFSLYKSQKIMYSKTRAEFINRETH